ncbi:MAG: hypothetical protein BroJett003_08060 [Planctomycetota bacterium]|nr:MAG: hypothetical protein BroJett003_08060 [Planctomycetota bacterium]
MTRLRWMTLAVLPALGIGCTVGQPAGDGRTLTLREESIGAAYRLYLPHGYRAGGPPHPLVVTFHGMKPFDTAAAQIREWQDEADRYGYVVLAPSLSVSSFGHELPLSSVSGSLQSDEQATLAVMDEVFRTTNVDPGAVLVTSWSYGGYVAHYMFNRHPDRFSCLAVKQSNFNSDLLIDASVPAYAHKPIAIFYTENDFRRNRFESQQAAQWYARRGFDVTLARFVGRGHERTPGPAAAFFARTCGAAAKSPPWELAFLQVVDPLTVNDLDGKVRSSAAGGLPINGSDRISQSAAAQPPSSGHVAPRLTGVPPASSAPGATRESSDARTRKTPGAVSVRTQNAPAPEPAPAPAEPRTEREVVSISVTPAIAVAPLKATFRAFVPQAFRQGCAYRWMLADREISQQVSGSLTLNVPGEYVLRLIVVDAAGRRHEAVRPLTVLERLDERKEGGRH